MDNFDRNFDKMRKVMIVAIIAKLAIFGGLIWLAVYAINAFTG